MDFSSQVNYSDPNKVNTLVEFVFLIFCKRLLEQLKLTLYEQIIKSDIEPVQEKNFGRI